MSRGAGPAIFQRRISSRYSPDVGPHSVESVSASASLTSRSFTTRALSRFSCWSAKCDLRAFVYAVRAVEKRRHSESSDARSIRGRAFHLSSRSRSLLAPLRQSLPAASFSASATMRSFSTLASACFSARSTLRASRCWPITSPNESSRPSSDARSPTALASATWPRTVRTDSAASSGDITPDLIRWSRRSTSKARASNRSV